MDLYTVLVFVFLFASVSAEQPRYRSDYVYNSLANAFYKLHIDAVRIWRAKEICAVEGAKLLVPTSQQDITQSHTLFKKYPDLGDYVWVDTDGQYHESVEEHPIINLEPESNEEDKGNCDVLTRDGEVDSYSCFHHLPFVCKVDAQDIYYNTKCNVYGKGYEYYPSVGSCYKIPRYVYSWSQAYEECKAEGSHLVILNSEAEHEIVWNLTKTSTAVDGAKASWFFFAGFRAERPKNGTARVFKTIFNETLDETGYNQWSENEPNNYQDTEYCGSIFKNDGKYNDLNCDHLYAFICEKTGV